MATHDNKNNVVYMIQAAHGSSEEPYPGAPIGIFHDYAAARAAFDAYEHPMSDCYRDTRIIAFLTMSFVNAYGILTETHIYAHKTNMDKPPAAMSAWDAMRLG